MRRLALVGSFPVLMVALVLLWNHRFERVPGMPTWQLADFRAEAPEVSGVEWSGPVKNPVLTMSARTPRAALRLAIPNMPAVGMLHLRYRMAANGLLKGPEKWQTGRLSMEWHSPDGSAGPEVDGLGGVHGHASGSTALVVIPEAGPAIPALRVEHLGLAGTWQLSAVEIIPVRERLLWRIGSWLLAAGWLAWCFALIRAWHGTAVWRALAVASIWLLMGFHFAVPGPWKNQRPFTGDFHLGEMSSLVSNEAPPVDGNRPEIRSTETAAHGQLPIRGSLALRIKLLITWARPLLHALLLCAPVLASAWLAGRRPTVALAVLLSLLIESAQTAFGYGFDWIDLTDLVTDGAGIALGLWLCGRIPALGKWLPAKAVS